MNRRLLSRGVFGASASRSAERPDYFKVHLEPLERRHLLAGATYYVNDTWTDGNGGTLNFGDSVSAALVQDPNSVGVSGTYGIDCFGKSTTGSFTAGSEHIADAITAAASADTVSLLEGTYTESDIIINKQVVFTGTGLTGTATTKIIPEVVSAKTGGALAEFGTGTHSGLIIYSDKVTVQNVLVDGNGNGSLSGTHNFHQGITTLYDTQAGGPYASIRNGNVSLVQHGNVPDPGGRPNRSEGLILIQNVRVDNTFWHGITLSANSGQQYGMVGTAAQNQIINSVVNNVGPAGSQDSNRVGILAMNLDGYPNESPGLGAIPAGNILQCTINNAGVGAALRTYGTYSQHNGARIKGALNYTTVTNAVAIGIDYDHNDGGVGKVNSITMVPGNTGIGMRISNSSTGRYSNNTINNAFIGMKILDSRYNSLGGEGFPIPGLMSITGPGTGVAGSVGILATNSAAAPEASLAMSFGTNVTGYQTGVKLEQPFSTAGTFAISGAANNGSGQIRITTSAPHSLVSGVTVIVSGVQGTTEANGKRIVTVVDSTHFDLDGSTFTNAYTSGGTWQYPQSVFALDNPNVFGNATGYSISGNYHVEGHLTGNQSIVASGIELKAGNDIQPFKFYNSISNQTLSPSGNPATVDSTPPAPADIVSMPNTVDTITSGNLTLDSASRLRVDLVATQAYKDVEDFNGAPFAYTLTTQTNPWRNGFVSPGALGLWLGNTSQSGGSLTVGPATTELGAVFDLGTINNPKDMRGMQMVQVVAKKVTGANPENFAVVFGDTDGTSFAYLFPTAGLNTSTYTTLTLNILSTAVKVQDCLDGLNMSAISAWAVVSDLGDSNMQASDTFGLNVDSIGLVSPLANSRLNVNGTVNLNGAALNAAVNNFTPSISQSFTIIDNDASDAVSGTFAGLPEGGTTNIGGMTFKVSYVGGTGNDVTLTRMASASTSVVNTKLFYKGSSKWNVTNGATFSDDNAIAPDKTAYLPNSTTSTFAAVSSYDKGINGLMIDLSGAHGAISASDFIFKVGNNNSPSLWSTGTLAAAVTVTTRAGVGSGGSDRIELMWANNTIQKQWLEVVVKGNDALGGSNTNTGLTSSYVFYFGNALGDGGVGNTSTTFPVSSADEINARNNPKTFNATRSDVNDFNRDGSVNSADQIIARNNTTSLSNQLKALVVGPGGPFAPDSSGGGGSGGGDSGVASGLAAGSSSSSSSSNPGMPGWLNLRLESLSGAANASSGSLIEGDSSQLDDGDDDDDSVDDELLDLLVSVTD